MCNALFNKLFIILAIPTDLDVNRESFALGELREH